MTAVPAPAITAFRDDYEFLSSFYEEAPLVTPSGAPAWWPTAEHRFQARKASDPAQAAWVAAAPNALEAKRRGRVVQLRPGWDGMRRRVMMEVQLDKFSNPALSARLTATRGRVLIEGNYWGDTFWGAAEQGARGWDAQLPYWHDLATGSALCGHNWLGRILMMIRDLDDEQAW